MKLLMRKTNWKKISNCFSFFLLCLSFIFSMCSWTKYENTKWNIQKKKILQQIIVYRKIFEKKSLEFPEKFTNFLVHWEVKKEGRRKLENRKHFANFVNLFVVCVNFWRTVVFFWYFLWKECCRKKKNFNRVYQVIKKELERHKR